MNPLLLLAIAAAGGYILYTQTKSAAPSPSNALLTTPGGGAYTDPSQIAPPNPAAYGVTPVPNGEQPGAPAVVNPDSSVAAYHTGYSCARTGAPIVSDPHGNPYLIG